MNKKTFGKIGCGCGGLLLFLSILSMGFWGWNVFIEPGGGISADEAFPGLVGSFVCCSLLLPITLVAALVAFKKDKPENG